MKKLLPLLALPVLILSCGESSDSESATERNFEFSYTTDTVVVDAGEHFFFLNWDLQLADVSQDRKYLYNLNPLTYLIEIVDLDNLKLKKTIQLAKEGPDGVGANYYEKIQVLENGNICLFGQFKINIVSEQGKLVNSIEFDQKDHIGYELKEDEKISYRGVFSADGKKYAGVLDNTDFFQPAKGLVIIDMETDSITYIPIDLFSRLKQFEIIFQEGSAPGIATGEYAYFSFMKDNLIISSSAYNEVHHYNMSNDSLTHHRFKASLTENEKILNYPNYVSSHIGWKDSSTAKDAQVTFKEFFKLTEQNIIWRLSTGKKRTIGDSTLFNHVATFFDPELNMLKEQELENFHDFRNPFFKDGMLYSFLNINDELAFVRLKPNFKGL